MSVSCAQDNQPATQLLSHEFAVAVTPTPFAKGLRFRLLEEGDYDGAFLGLLRQLTTVGDVTREQFEERASKAREDPNTYIVVIEDTEHVRAADVTHTLPIGKKVRRGSSALYFLSLEKGGGCRDALPRAKVYPQRRRRRSH